MPTYFDSSVLLSILKNDSHAQKAAELWAANSERVSSLLLEVECLIVLRRTAKHFAGKFDQNWLFTQEEKLKYYLEEVELRRLDEEILNILHLENHLSDCRALDAIHLATALFFRTASPTDFFLATFDIEMSKTAKELGIPLSPNLY